MANETGWIRTVKAFDNGLQAALHAICGVLILCTVLFTIYTVFMRYIIGDPPFWGDTIALFANIWLVVLALALAVHTPGQIAMEAVYEMCPPIVSFVLEIIWNSFIVAFEIFLAYFGWIAARDTPSMFWELNNLEKSTQC